MKPRDLTDAPPTFVEAATQAGAADFDHKHDRLAREALLAALDRASEHGVDWPGWDRTIISGSKVQRPAFRRRASLYSRNLLERGVRIKPRSGRTWSPFQGMVRGPRRATHRSHLPREYPRDKRSGRNEGQTRACSGRGACN